jgi:hypothetical protein
MEVPETEKNGREEKCSRHDCALLTLRLEHLETGEQKEGRAEKHCANSAKAA